MRLYFREPEFVRPRTLRGRSPLNQGMCRILSVLAALIALLVLSPLMLAVAVAVKLSSEGPILFTQPRALVRCRKVEYEGEACTLADLALERQFGVHAFEQPSHD